MSSDIYQKVFNLSTLAMVIIQTGSQIANSAYARLSGYTLNQLSQLSFQDLIAPTDYPIISNAILNLLPGQTNPSTYRFHILSCNGKLIPVEGIFTSIDCNGQPAILLQLLGLTRFKPDFSNKEDESARVIKTLQKKDGTIFPSMLHTTQVLSDQKPIGLRGIIWDITERKQVEAQLKHLIEHDALTGLYNRSYFESELNKRQQCKSLLGIIVLDVDGLKLINDTLGHNHGDKLLKAIADLMKENFRADDILARIGGDEFAVLMIDIDENGITKLIRQLNSAIFAYNQAHTRVPLNISCGYVLGVGSAFSTNSLFKEADNNMRKEKLFHSQSNRSAIVQTLKKALEARDFITEGHADRLHDLVLQLTTSIGFPENHKNDLRLFAQFHDIGKVGIPDRILFKNGPLTKEEQLEMRRHPEIGYRIAQSAPDLAPIAEWILHHHEWWNGNGYPLGIKGEKIPLACRLLAIVDAFDAMTNDRPYRKSLSLSASLTELKKCAGTQFDPELVKNFIEVMHFNG
jgi:diguanylate cyclase (GGDEF)-like protein/PAS domain S-box-containing protein